MLASASRVEVAPNRAAIRNVLVVDDSRAQRLLILSRLRGLGFTLFEAESGTEAMALCEGHAIDLVLSDWIMPGMSGIDFCRWLRSRQTDRYIYFILLTSNTDKSAVAEGLEVGADDFLSKPVDPPELIARIKAGERLLTLERDLRQKNLLLSDTVRALETAQDAISRDLAEARNLQLSLVRDRERQLEGGVISLLLRPSGQVGGDMVGFFDIGAGLTGLYNFDVSGHGVTSALLTARIAGLLSGASPEQNIAIEQGASGARGRDPAAVVQTMNRIMLSEIQTDRYLTIAYAELDSRSGDVRMVQSGHPHPTIIHEQGHCTLLGTGGMPVGLVEQAQWESFGTRLRPGQRLLLTSDGVTECPNPEGVELGHDGLEAIIARLHGLRGSTFLDAIIWELGRWHGSEDFPDDVSLALFDFQGAPE